MGKEKKNGVDERRTEKLKKKNKKHRKMKRKISAIRQAGMDYEYE